MKALITVALALALVVTPFTVTTVPANHGGSFPLPPKHSVIAQTAKDMSAQMGSFCRPGAEEIIARFNAGGYHWFYAYSADTQIGMFVQFPLDEPQNAIRVWIFKGDADDITIIRHVENPLKIFPNGPCSVLYPDMA